VGGGGVLSTLVCLGYNSSTNIKDKIPCKIESLLVVGLNGAQENPHVTSIVSQYDKMLVIGQGGKGKYLALDHLCRPCCTQSVWHHLKQNIFLYGPLSQ